MPCGDPGMPFLGAQRSDHCDGVCWMYSKVEVGFRVW